MTDAQQSMLRALLKIGSGALVTKGYTDSDTAEQLAGAALAVVTIVWGMRHRTPAPEKPNTPNPS